MKVLVINGVNLNMLGQRDHAVYGSDTLEKIIAETNAAVAKHGVEIEWWQSNAESEIVEKIQTLCADALVINAGAFTHYSLAIHDALEIPTVPKIELHISNIFKREAFRRTSVLSDACDGIIAGLGKYGYIAAVLAAVNAVQTQV